MMVHISFSFLWAVLSSNLSKTFCRLLLQLHPGKSDVCIVCCSVLSAFLEQRPPGSASLPRLILLGTQRNVKVEILVNDFPNQLQGSLTFNNR